MQILWHCQRINKDEWSGVLFYSVKGKFGEPDFSIMAEELFLMDIGSSTYTSYKLQDPELVKFMMSDPVKYLGTFKKGHIHSHNNMGVFFSGTDKDELRDNAPLHNVYLSLIVNNRNEMEARVAFKAQVKTEEKSIFTFRDFEGEWINKEQVSTVEKEAIYSYECQIGLQEESEGTASRFQQVQSKVVERETVEKESTKISSLYTSRYSSFHNEDRGGPELFDQDAGKSGISSIEEGGLCNLPPTVGRVVYSLSAKMVTLDQNYRGSLREALSSRNDAFFGPKKWRKDLESYKDNVRKMSSKFYMHAFPNDTDFDGYSEFMEYCCQAIEEYQDKYPKLTEELTKVLKSKSVF